MEIKGVPQGTDEERFRQKARTYLLAHEDVPAVRKLYTNEQITAADLAALSEVFLAEGIASPDDLDHVQEREGGLGLFLRRIRGLDRQAADGAFADFMTSHELSARQMDLVLDTRRTQVRLCCVDPVTAREFG